MKKLKRDIVVSSTDKGDLVGVYFENEPDNVLEMSPEKADRVIEAYNNDKTIENETCNNCGESFEEMIEYEKENGEKFFLCYDCAGEDK